jgi:hypothetical protein
MLPSPIVVINSTRRKASHSAVLAASVLARSSAAEMSFAVDNLLKVELAFCRKSGTSRTLEMFRAIFDVRPPQTPLNFVRRSMSVDGQ